MKKHYCSETWYYSQRYTAVECMAYRKLISSRLSCSNYRIDRDEYSSVMLSHRGQSGLEAKILASASDIWPRPGLDLVVLLCNRAFFWQKSCKIREFGNFSGNNLKSYVVNHYLVLFHNYFWPRAWPQPPEIGLGLGLEVLASFNIS